LICLRYADSKLEQAEHELSGKAMSHQRPSANADYQERNVLYGNNKSAP
jgi:hypothetical protein